VSVTFGEPRRRDGDETLPGMFRRTVEELGDAPLILAGERPISARRVAELAGGLAGSLSRLGVGEGDRVALHLQNDPQHVVALLAIWSLGAVAVPCSPMLRVNELAKQLRDAGAGTLIGLEDLYAEVGAEAAGAAGLERVVLTDRDDLTAPRAAARPAGTHDFMTLAAAPASLEPRPPQPREIAVLTYTSGTTGPAKGAVNTHGNVAAASRLYRDGLGVGAADTILGIAPLFHVTGLSGHIGLSLAAGAPLVLAHRFDVPTVCRLAELHGATMTIAAITAYLALANDPATRPAQLASLRLAYSGGAPIAPATLTQLEQKLGLAIKPVYGLTETSGPTHLAPPGSAVPVDPASGALSVGLALPGTAVRILDDDGRELEGGTGEVAVRGPQVVPGYWEKPDESAAAIRDGELRTGDIGKVDEDGWLYLVDRGKDLIIASGFKVWPREVEDVLYEHPAVREAAVVGVDDDYRGETVWAYVSLESGVAVLPEELVAHCRERLASYKYPRVVRILDELPKTASGKILRRAFASRPVG
jgi:long-chain acyl-CoA synthetase